MITLLGAIIGFLGSSIPALLKYFQSREDNRHELASMDRQIELAKLRIESELQAVQAEAQSAEMQVLHLTEKPTNSWIDKLNASVRPVIAYGMFSQYIWIRYKFYEHLLRSDIDFNFLIETIWDNQDMGILSSVISFYFGSRYYDKKWKS